jgi:O-acetyl-ADP-ribose deacetylase
MTQIWTKLRSSMTPKEWALDRVNTLVDGGWSVEGACAKIALEEGVDQGDLLRTYELQFDSFCPDPTSRHQSSDKQTIGQPMKIEIVLEDIAKQPSCVAVVNSANANLRLGSGVAGAIHMAAGPELEDYCEPLAPLGLGKAVITPGFSLPNQWVIHLRSSHYLNDDEPEKVMRDAVISMLKIVGANHIPSIALPAIGTGVFKFPHQLAAEIIANTLSEFGPTLAPCLERVRICLATATLVPIFSEAVEKTGLDLHP